MPTPDPYVYPSGHRSGELVDLVAPSYGNKGSRPLGRITHPGPRPIPGRVYVVTSHGTHHYHPDSLAPASTPEVPR